MYLPAISQFHLNVLFSSYPSPSRRLDRPDRFGLSRFHRFHRLLGFVWVFSLWEVGTRGKQKSRPARERTRRTGRPVGLLLIARNYLWRPINSDWLDGWSATSPRTRTSSKKNLFRLLTLAKHTRKRPRNRPRFQNLRPPPCLSSVVDAKREK